MPTTNRTTEPGEEFEGAYDYTRSTSVIWKSILKFRLSCTIVTVDIFYFFRTFAWKSKLAFQVMKRSCLGPTPCFSPPAINPCPLPHPPPLRGAIATWICVRSNDVQKQLPRTSLIENRIGLKYSTKWHFQELCKTRHLLSKYHLYNFLARS